MAFTSTTNTLTKSTADFIGPLTGLHADTYALKVNYTKGDESTATLAVSFIFNKISTSTQFKCSTLNTATAAQLIFSLSATGIWYLPFSIPPSADKVVVALSSTGSTATGTIIIDGWPEVD